MATLSNGTYYIFNVAAVTRVLDVTANSPTDGANIYIWDYNQTDAQVWTVTDAYGSTKRIINRLSGKSLDVDGASTAAGTNVQIWTNTDPQWQGQRLAITDAVETAMIEGETYDCYYISMSNSTGMVFTAVGTSNYSNVQLAPIIEGPAQSQLWCFVPVPAFRDGGIYEIASALNYDLRLDVAGAGKTNGTNLQLFSANQTNAQKFYVTVENPGEYSLKSIVSGLYVDVDSALAQDDANVQIWDDNDTVAQRWNLVPYGDTSIDGENCNKYLIGSYVTNDGQTYYMNVQNAVKSSNANVLIHTLTSNVDAATFALIPSWEVDESLPVPYDLGCSGLGLTYSNSWTNQNANFYLTWKCASSWVSSGPGHYEIRTRTRLMSSYTSTWGAWSSWSAWETANTTESGNQFWEQTAQKIQYSYNTAKNAQLQFQVRACGVSATDSSQQTVGMSATKTISVYKRPSVAITSAEWSHKGLRLYWTGDYSFGTTEFKYSTIQFGRAGTSRLGKNALIDPPKYYDSNTASGSTLIPLDQLSEWPSDNDISQIYSYVGYDQASPDLYPRTISHPTISYKSGYGDYPPTFEWHGVKLIATIKSLGSVSEPEAWVRYKDGTMHPCPRVTGYSNPSGTRTYDVPYPFGETYEFCCIGFNVLGDWYTNVTEMPAVEKYFHSFTWIRQEDGKEFTAYLECFPEGEEQFQVTKNAVYQADVLDSRPYESVSASNTVKTHLTIGGILVDDFTTTNVEDIRYMVNHHVLWRSPIHGNYADLYISDVTLTERKNRTEVTISAIKETI